MDHSMHMGMGHGDMGHGDMDMGGKCNMNVRYTLHICFDLMLISNI
jgi:copper transporter 1